jgi:hypothetical protein
MALNYNYNTSRDAKPTGKFIEARDPETSTTKALREENEKLKELHTMYRYVIQTWGEKLGELYTQLENDEPSENVKFEDYVAAVNRYETAEEKVEKFPRVVENLRDTIHKLNEHNIQLLDGIDRWRQNMLASDARLEVENFDSYLPEGTFFDDTEILAEHEENKL